MNYLDIPRQTVKIFWKHKVLWGYAFTVFAVPVLISFTGVGIFLCSIDMSHPEKVVWLWDPLASQLGMVAYFVMVALMLLCATLSFGGVLKGASLLLDGEENVLFSTLFGAGLRYFGRVGGLLFLVAGVWGMITLIGMKFDFIYSPAYPIFLIPAFYLGRIVVELMMAVMVREDSSFFDSWRYTWEISRKKPRQLVLVTFVLDVVVSIASQVLIIPIFIIWILLIISFFVVGLPSDFNSFLFRAYPVAILLICLFALVEGGILAFHSIAYMLIYQHFSPKEEFLVS